MDFKYYATFGSKTSSFCKYIKTSLDKNYSGSWSVILFLWQDLLLQEPNKMIFKGCKTLDKVSWKPK